jgi:DNA-binding NarL/FixJ family response regulator
MALPAAGDGVAEAVLSSRQREVLQLIAEGYSTRDIAARLCISVKTVETHRAEIMRRLSLFDVASLTRYALRIGLVQDGR